MQSSARSLGQPGARIVRDGSPETQVEKHAPTDGLLIGVPCEVCEEAGEAKAVDSPATATAVRIIAQNSFVNALALVKRARRTELGARRRILTGGGVALIVFPPRWGDLASGVVIV